MVIIVA